MKILQYFVYILANKLNTTLSIGVTNDLERRIYGHKNKSFKGFSRRYQLSKLVYFEETNDTHEAINREKQLKNWHRSWKENVNRKHNPYWQDLSKSWDISLARDAETSSA